MKKILLSVAALCAMFTAPSLAEAAVRGVATANVNMRSGPSTAYPAVVVIPVGAPVTINGCMSSVNWCDVSFSGGRGWVSGNYVQATYRSNRVYVAPDYYQGLGIPSVTFDVNTYWGRYYRNRDFYSQRDRWRSYDWRSDRSPPPPPPRWEQDRRDPPPPRWDRDRDRDPPRWDRDRDRDRGDWRPGDREPPPPPRWEQPRRDDRGPPRYDPPRGGDRPAPPPRYDPPPPRVDPPRGGGGGGGGTAPVFRPAAPEDTRTQGGCVPNSPGCAIPNN